MKPVQQTILTPPTGNCLSACVASLFELPIWLVPNFTALDRWHPRDNYWIRLNTETEPLWWDRLCSFACEQGWRVFQLSRLGYGVGWGAKFLHGDYGIATVRSSRGPHFHCVIAEVLTGEIVWDPHPEGYSEGHVLDEAEVLDWIFFVALK